VGADSVTVLLTVLARDEAGAETRDPRRSLVLSGVSRLVSSYRVGEELVPLDPEGLREVLRRNGGTPVYGWEFVDSGDAGWATWRDRLSLDLVLGGPGGHHLTLFQDLQGKGVLDLRVWFADLAVLDGVGDRMDLGEFLAQGQRWWTAMYAGERSDLAPGIRPG